MKHVQVRSLPTRLPLCGIFLSAWVAGAGDFGVGTGIKVDSRDIVNWALLHDADTGAYQGGPESAVVLKLEPRYEPARVTEKRDYGIKLKLGISVSAHLFDVVFEDAKLDEDLIESVSLLPKVEVPMRFRENWIITPFQQVGVGYAYKDEVAEWTSSTGIASAFAQPDLPYLRKVELGVSYNTMLSDTALEDESYGVVSLKAEMNRPFWEPFGKYQPSLLPYAKVGYFYDTLVLGTEEIDRIEVRREYEIGVVVGTEPRIRIWKIKIPRITLGYRFGDGLKAIRLKFGG